MEMNTSNIRGTDIAAISLYEPPPYGRSIDAREGISVPKSEDVSLSLGNGL